MLTLESRYRQALKINVELGDLPKAAEWAEKVAESMIALIGADSSEYRQLVPRLSRLQHRARMQQIVEESRAARH